jgi:dinuclear metal center YbgI/SA1388 family protein
MMNGIIQLNPRLQLAASMVRRGTKLADIGTDHGYLPIALLQQNAVSTAIGADLREGPLSHASKNAVQYGVADRISLRCCNGLTGIRPEEADDIVIAGMGGELIVSILRAAAWVKNPAKQLILQPMTSSEELRRYLRREGFFIEQEEAVEDAGRVYTVIRAVYAPERTQETFPGFDYIGALDMTSDAAQEFAFRQLRHLVKKLYGQQITCRPEAVHTVEMIRGIEERAGKGSVIFVGDIYDAIHEMAPFDTAMDFDNVGLLVGHRDQVVSTALLALDITPEVLQEAYANNAQLVISHHPVIFDPLKQLTYNHPAYMLAAMHLSAICAHTNLDMAAEGVNAVLARKLGLVNVTGIEKYGDCDEALMGELQTDMAPEGFAAYVRDCLDCGSVQLVNGGKTVRKVALCGGAGGSLLGSALRAGADAFVTGEAKHNQMLDAKAAGLTLVAAGHHHTEQPVMENLQKILAQKFPQVEFLLSECGTAPSVSL